MVALMMSALRPKSSQTIQNYPSIQIDRGNVIKPCNADQAAADQFIDRHKTSWRKIFYDAWHEGIPFILRYLSNLKAPENSNAYYNYLIKATRYIALLLLYVHRIYLYIYAYFYPYSLMPLDDVCDEFSRCPRWSEAVIRAFAWHPNHDRCAVAICNDYIYVYQGSTRIRVLRHAQQRKITDMVWQPNNKEVLIVATQRHIVIWRIGDNLNGTLSYIRDSSRSSAYLAPGVQLIMRGKESAGNSVANGSMKQTDSSMNNRCDTSLANQTNEKDFKILEHILPPPIISLQFDQTGTRLYACSPNSSKILILDVELLFGQDPAKPTVSQQGTNRKSIDYLTRYGQGFTQLLWSPSKNRLAAATTSFLVRVYEPFKWSHNKWSLQGMSVQDMVWSKPQGRMLLIANKSEPCLYALPFLDSPQAGDVGGNKSLMKALDLTATRTEMGDMVGGVVQSLAWDKNGKRLAISFKDNPESILLYRTVERPTVEFHQLGVIQSDNASTPLFMEFHDKFKNGSLLTICWSDGHCQHIPMSLLPNEQLRNGYNNDDSFNRSLNRSSLNGSTNDITSPPKTPRSLTNFCHVSGNNSISSYPASLMPINKVQHQTTLFSLSTRSILEDSTINNNSSRNSSDATQD